LIKVDKNSIINLVSISRS